MENVLQIQRMPFIVVVRVVVPPTTLDERDPWIARDKIRAYLDQLRDEFEELPNRVFKPPARRLVIDLNPLVEQMEQSPHLEANSQFVLQFIKRFDGHAKISKLSRMYCSYLPEFRERIQHATNVARDNIKEVFEGQTAKELLKDAVDSELRPLFEKIESLSSDAHRWHSRLTGPLQRVPEISNRIVATEDQVQEIARDAEAHPWQVITEDEDFLLEERKRCHQYLRDIRELKASLVDGPKRQRHWQDELDSFRNNEIEWLLSELAECPSCFQDQRRDVHAAAEALHERGESCEKLCEQMGPAFDAANEAIDNLSLNDDETKLRQALNIIDPALNELQVGEAASSIPVAEQRGAFRNQRSQPRVPVDCTVFAPRSVEQSSEFMVQVFVHIPSEAAHIETEARQFDLDTTKSGRTSLGTEVAIGSKLAFRLRFEKLELSDPMQQIEWTGLSNVVQFLVRVPADHGSCATFGTMDVSQNSVPIGRIVFKVRVQYQCGQQDTQPTGWAQRYKRAFISYAREDLHEVSRRVQMLSAEGTEYFQDVFSLRPGEQWLPRIYEAIDQSDVMYLFWSNASKSSPWVEKEWQYGLQKKGDGYVRPIAIEGPPVPDPPAEMAHLHFGDSLMYLIPMNRLQKILRWLRAKFGLQK